MLPRYTEARVDPHPEITSSSSALCRLSRCSIPAKQRGEPMQNMKAGAAAILVACCAPVVHAQTPQPKVIHNLPVSEAALVQENTGSGRVTGVLTNTSGRQLQSVVVQFSLLDD